MAAGAYPLFNNTDNRNTATIIPNAVEGITLTKLNSLDGTVIESAVLRGFFLSDVTDTSFSAGLGLTISNAAALSGGDYVIVGQRIPYIEFVDYSSNTANKEYILHAHGQQAGNVYLKTRTSAETITIPYNSTAGAVEALFEATADCVAATATGGPWPLLPISIDVEWSVAGGDISGISATNTYTGSEESVSWDYTNDTSTSIGVFTLTINTIKVGAQFKLTFPGGAEFFYTSATTNINTFVAAMGAALGSFVAINTGLVPGDDPGEVQWGTVSTNVLIMNFTNTLPHPGPVLATIVSGGGVISDSRLAGSCAAVYDTDTGVMSSAVGYMFGYSEHRPASRMFDDGGTNPTVTGLNVLGIQAIGSGPSNAVIITPQLRGTGDATKANVVERWDISGGEWAFNWEVFCNADMAMPQIIPCESGYVICPIGAKLFGGVNYRNAARIAVSDATVDELETNYASTTPPNNSSATVMYDSTPSSYLTWAYDGLYQDPVLANHKYRNNSDGSDTYLNGTLLRIGAEAFGCDGTSVYASFAGLPFTTLAPGTFTYVQFPEASGPLTPDRHYMDILAQPDVRSAEPQQFRFKFSDGSVTAWIDWYATLEEIHTALIDLLGENPNAAAEVPGFDSNVRLTFYYGSPPSENNPICYLEHNLRITFDLSSPEWAFNGDGYYIPFKFFSSNGVGNANIWPVKIEVQNVTAFTDPAGLAAYDATNAQLIWSRPWGAVGARTIEQPLYAWLEGDYVYAYGNLVDPEL